MKETTEIYSVENREGTINLSVIVMDGTYRCPHLTFKNKTEVLDTWDNDEYLLNDLIPFCRNYDPFASEAETLKELRADVEELDAVLTRGVELGFFKNTLNFPIPTKPKKDTINLSEVDYIVVGGKRYYPETTQDDQRTDNPRT
jgi:hypothetical protein